MALENQINVYSVDTGNFYSNKERYLHNKNAKIRTERKVLADKIKAQAELLKKRGYSEESIQKMTPDKISKIDIIAGTEPLVEKLLHWSGIKKYKNIAARSAKERLQKILENKMSAKGLQKSEVRDLRILDDSTITDKDVISLFESSLTRMIGIRKDEFTEDIIVVQVYYFDIFKDITFYGFLYKGEKYKYYTSSAGQIRKKKAVFIKVSTWNKYEKTIMCGLTIDKINDKGGNNVNKHLAYMALTNSATDEWSDFDIDRTIVIDDFETNVFGEYDLIDDSDYSVTRTKGEIPITHTDGAGMILHGKNRMIRVPWIKGLMGNFNFRDLILEWRKLRQDDTIGIIPDIYGKEHDIIAENIYAIFTKSQFKMYRYYDSWEEYKQYFKENNCKAGICNIEEDRIPNSKLNYQELQTLTAATDEDLDKITKPSIDKLKSICSSIENMQRVFGVTPYNRNMTPLQEAVKIYPNLMNDTYFKDILKGIKDSLTKKYKSAKLEVEGKYTFILPDFYAACEFWFLQNKDPEGLLEDGEVWCNLFKNRSELDCLRSPHLYKEHAIRRNVAKTGTGDRKELLSKWFHTSALYTSCHDLISKMLQFDVDGDHSLVIGDAAIVDIAKRSMSGVVPLYYNMRKSEPRLLNNQSIYDGLNAAFTGGNIGTYSNNISKIWNSDIFVNGTDEEKIHADNIVKLLCMENNFVIDYAKTLYKPERPASVNGQIKQFTNQLLPHFFIYAKDKELSQVCPRNNSIVNKLDSLIPNVRINTRKIGLGPIDHRVLMHDINVEVDEKLIEKYRELNLTYHFKISMKEEHQGNLQCLASNIREELSAFGYDDIEITDMLVKTLYGKKNRAHKELLWFSYGSLIVENLKKNVPARKTKFIQCIDCGEWFEGDIKDTNTERCAVCYPVYRKKRVAENVRNYRRNRM